jgi:hypothetical protein
MVDIHPDPWARHDPRRDAPGAGRGKMRNIAVLAEAQRHRQRRRQGDGIGAELVMGRRDGEGRRLAMRRQHRLDLGGRDGGDVAGQGDDSLRPLPGEQPRRGDDAAGMPVPRPRSAPARRCVARCAVAQGSSVTSATPRGRAWPSAPPAPRRSDCINATRCAGASAGERRCFAPSSSFTGSTAQIMWQSRDHACEGDLVLEAPHQRRRVDDGRLDAGGVVARLHHVVRQQPGIARGDGGGARQDARLRRTSAPSAPSPPGRR